MTRFITTTVFSFNEVISHRYLVSALGPRKSLFGPVSQPPATKGRPVTYGSGFVATASDAGGPGKSFSSYELKISRFLRKNSFITCFLNLIRLSMIRLTAISVKDSP